MATTTGLRDRLREEMLARQRVEQERANRDTVRDYARTALLCLLWAALGLFLIGWSLHTTSPVYGRIAFLSGVAVGNGGWIFTMLGAYRRGEERGDW